MTETAPPGATPDDWACLTRAGVLKDLLPVAMDMTASVSKTSALAKQSLRGKVPSHYTRKGEIVGIPQWTARVTTQADVDTWSAEPTLGICIQTRDVRALDIDLDDPVAAQRVLDFVALTHPDLPARGRENSGKVLLAFRCAPGVDMPYRCIATPDGVIELLSSGKQFVAVGTHTSGVRYQWEEGTPTAFPELPPSEFEELWAALKDTFADLSLPQYQGRTTGSPTKRRDLADVGADDVLAFLVERDHVRTHRPDGGVDIFCPFAASHTTEDTPSATTYFPAGVGGFERGHFRCLHAHCADRTDDAFLFVLGYVAEQFAVAPDASTGEASTGEASTGDPPDTLRFTRDTHGRILHTINNAIIALRSAKLCAATFFYDSFRQSEMMVEECKSPREMTDTDVLRLWAGLERFGFLPVASHHIVGRALDLVVHENVRDTAIEWAQALRWDNVPRVDTAMSRYFGLSITAAQDQGLDITAPQLADYGRAVGRYLFTALAGRCLEPGCKADMSIILVGEQGTGKTTSVQALAPFPDAHTEIDLAHMGADAGRKMRGKMVVELAELRGLAGKDAEAVKAWLSETEDRWVPKFKERAVAQPRRCVALGTTNDVDILHDRSGSRRFLPLPVGPADVEALKVDRDQLWAEGIVLWRQYGVLYAEAQTIAKGYAQVYASEGTYNDTWADAAATFAKAQWHTDSEGGVRIGDFMESALNIARKDQTKAAQQRAARALKAAGFTRRRGKADGLRHMMWYLEVDTARYLV